MSPRMSTRMSGRMSGRMSARRVREVVAQVVWVLCLLCAVLLAVGALLVALKANEGNALVKTVLHGADAVSVGIFDKSNGIKQFTGHDAQVKDALFNWGIGAIAWLVVGRVLERLIRPGAADRT